MADNHLNLTIENNLLGAYLNNPDLFAKCSHLVSQNIFSQRHTKWAYKAIKHLHEQGIKPDVTLLFVKAKEGGLPQADCAKIASFIDPPYEYISQPEQYVTILFKESVAKFLYPIFESSAKKLSDYSDDAIDVLSEVKEAITKVELVLNNVSKEKDVKVVFDEAVKRIEDLKSGEVKQNGFSFGLTELDAKTGGINTGINIIGAVPGSGKTSLLINIIIQNAIHDNKPIMFFSLEMPAIEIMTNMIANFAQINSRALRQGDVDAGQEMTIKTMRDRLKNNFVIDDTGGISWQYIEAKTRAFRKSRKIPMNEPILCMIDYLQLMTNSADEWKGTNDEQRISITCNQLTRISKNDNLATILLSQLSRPEKDRKTPRPRMSDLKGSGAIEACAILILLMFRPDYHGITEDEQGRDLRGLCEINPVKGRYIKPEPVYARFIGKYSQFLDCTVEDKSEPF